MKKFYFLSFVFTSIFLFSQSTIDTQNWIEDKYDEFYYMKDDQSGNSQATRAIRFENNTLVLQLDFYSHGQLTMIQTQRINLKKVNKIEIHKFRNWDRVIWNIDLKCINNLQCVEINKSFLLSKEEEQSSGKILNLPLDEGFGNENLPNRMSKAFSDLLKKMGGNASVIVKKEAY